jgi:hypothetical protein
VIIYLMCLSGSRSPQACSKVHRPASGQNFLIMRVNDGRPVRAAPRRLRRPPTASTVPTAPPMFRSPQAAAPLPQAAHRPELKADGVSAFAGDRISAPPASKCGQSEHPEGGGARLRSQINKEPNCHESMGTSTPMRSRANSGHAHNECTSDNGAANLEYGPFALRATSTGAIAIKRAIIMICDNSITLVVGESYSPSAMAAKESSKTLA